MAQRGKPIPVGTIQQIKRLREVTSIRGTARESGTARNTVRKYTRPPK